MLRTMFGGFLACLLFTLAEVHANIPASRQRAEVLGRQLVEAQVVAEKKTFGDWIWKEIEAYDLSKEGRKVMETVAEEEAFQKFLEQRGVVMVLH